MHWVLSPVLAFAIYLAILNLSTTYFRLENYQREAVWSLVHLNTQLQSTQQDIQLYEMNALDIKALRIRYELLWSKFAVIQNNIEQDSMLRNITELQTALNESFNNFKAMERAVYSGEVIPPSLLDKWIAELSHAHEIINRYLIHEIADADGSYSRASWYTLLDSLYLVAAASLAFFVHIGYVLLSLVRERSDNLFKLNHDALTSLANRSHSMTILDQSCRENMFFTLVIIDLNEFKKVNDTHGHPAGDQILIHLSNTFRKTINRHGLVGRLGGDEFVWIINTTDQEVVKHHFQELLEQLAQAYIINGYDFYLKLSAGASICHGNNPDPKSLMAQADSAMYQAKKSGSTEIAWYKANETPAKNTYLNMLFF
ncbi:GGDEF domain-containing protein [Thiofilum flexile]|uniref:GGDEF domain-containing protein n=1 Tax=Thiofilum flexile TaxID=125627 RepID=UPI0003747A15|nr:GGDEF domain-containing protein [Thiofilum flexile]